MRRRGQAGLMSVILVAATMAPTGASTAALAWQRAVVSTGLYLPRGGRDPPRRRTGQGGRGDAQTAAFGGIAVHRYRTWRTLPA